jgi:HEAT repeat protein
MSANRPSRGLLLPAFGHWLVLAATIGGIWLVWSEFRRQQALAEQNAPFPDPCENLLAVERFVRRGRDGVPGLVAGLASSDPKARGYAAFGLGQIGPDAAGALRDVRERLGDGGARVRVHALAALRSISQDSTEVLPDIARMLADPDDDVREQATHELVIIGPVATGSLLEMLHSSRASSRRLAIQTLRELARKLPDGQRAEIGEAIRPSMNDSEPAVRLEARTLLVEWRLASPADVKDLLHNHDVLRTGIALRAVAALEDGGAELLPDILELLQHSNRQILYDAIRSLRDLGAAASPAVPVLLSLLDRSSLSAGHQNAVVEALAAMGSVAKSAVPKLLEIIVRSEASPQHNDGSTQDELHAFQAKAIAALERIGDDGPLVMSTLRSKLESPSSEIRVAAIGALVRLAANSSEVLSDIVRRLDDESNNVRAHAALAIGRSSCKGNAAVAPLIVALADEHAYIRTAAAISLGQIGQAANSALPALREASRDPFNAIPNSQLQHPHFRGLSYGSRVRLRELDQLSVAQAAQQAIAAIESSPIAP